MLPNLVRPSDYYPLLIVQAGSDDIEERSLKAIKRDWGMITSLLLLATLLLIQAGMPLAFLAT